MKAPLTQTVNSFFDDHPDSSFQQFWTYFIVNTIPLTGDSWWYLRSGISCTAFVKGCRNAVHFWRDRQSSQKWRLLADEMCKMCKMNCGSFWSLFDVNPSTFHRYARKMIFTFFSSDLQLQLFHLKITCTYRWRSNIPAKYNKLFTAFQLSVKKHMWQTNIEQVKHCQFSETHSTTGRISRGSIWS